MSTQTKAAARSILLLLAILLIPLFYVVYLEPEIAPGIEKEDTSATAEDTGEGRTFALAAPQAGTVSEGIDQQKTETDPRESGSVSGADNDQSSGQNRDRPVRPPTDPVAQLISGRVYNVIEEVQLRQRDNQWEESLNEMNALYSEFDTLNSLEQATLLNFYTNTLVHLEMWQESISAFSLMLTIDGLRPDLNARALRALGQLHTRVGEPEAAVGYYEEWLKMAAGEPVMEAQAERVQHDLELARAAL